jgi:hypothetical protein
VPGESAREVYACATTGEPGAQRPLAQRHHPPQLGHGLLVTITLPVSQRELHPRQAAGRPA